MQKGHVTVIPLIINAISTIGIYLNNSSIFKTYYKVKKISTNILKIYAKFVSLAKKYAHIWNYSVLYKDKGHQGFTQYQEDWVLQDWLWDNQGGKNLTIGYFHQDHDGQDRICDWQITGGV